MSTVFIKNMVCNRCIMAVKDALLKAGMEPVAIQLGEVQFAHPLSAEEKGMLETVLTPLGFALIDDKKSRIIEQIKSLIIDIVHHKNNELGVNLSDYLSKHLHLEYNYLSNLFSEVEGNTIEKYYIAQKIEKVKELLVYDELSLSEISDQLNYSSVAHLSAQFKKVTGLTPSYFKQIRLDKRKPLDEV